MEFNEYMIKRKKSAALKLLSFLIYFIATILALLSLVLLLRYSGIGLLVAVAFYYFAHKISSQMNKEFEYIRTEDILDVDVIINKTKRKRLISFSVKNAEIIASLNNASYNERLKKSFSKVIDATSGHRDANVYFAIIEDKNTLVKFEPTFAILTNLQVYAPSKVIIDE